MLALPGKWIAGSEHAQCALTNGIAEIRIASSAVARSSRGSSSAIVKWLQLEHRRKSPVGIST